SPLFPYTTLFRSTVPSFRTRWVSPPSSTNPDPAATTSGVQVGSSARYNIRAPALTITRLGPGCECQPKDPPGTMMFCNIQTSDSPFVLMRACQLLEDSARSEEHTSELQSRGH